MEQLIAELRQNTAANRELADSVRVLAGAVHALADSLAACTTEPAPEEEGAARGAVVELYADGTPVGPY